MNDELRKSLLVFLDNEFDRLYMEQLSQELFADAFFKWLEKNDLMVAAKAYGIGAPNG